MSMTNEEKLGVSKDYIRHLSDRCRDLDRALFAAQRELDRTKLLVRTLTETAGRIGIVVSRDSEREGTFILTGEPETEMEIAGLVYVMARSVTEGRSEEEVAKDLLNQMDGEE